ncbi:MAG: prepilin-type N-terminal cleavage/methylation domain-containing protein [bacterium]
MTKKIKPKNKNGFTIMELIIYMAVFIIIATALITFTLDLLRIQTKVQIKKEVLDSAQRSIDVISWEIKHAKSIYDNTCVAGAHPGQLSLKTIQNTPDGETETYVDFYLDDNDNLCIKREGQSGELLTSENVKISNLVFSNFTAGDTQAIQIDITAFYNSSREQAAYHATTTLTSSAILRNE